MKRPIRFVAGICALMVAFGGLAAAVEPSVFSQPFHQSPVHGDPGDLLLIAGADFEAGGDVVYELSDGASTPPAAVPGQDTAQQGVAAIRLQTKNNLTVKLPQIVTPGAIYELWVRNPGSSWVGPLLINDARPLWLTPAQSYATQRFASLPRELKVVGRNLQAVPGGTTRVRLTRGAYSKILVADDDGDPDTAIEQYVARVKLPSPLPAGLYDVAVDKGDGRWVGVDGQQFEVLEDTASRKLFPLTDYGCTAGDSQDDTACVLSAISDAAVRGGDVYFGRGRWLLGDAGAVTHGIVVEQGVGLVGQGAARTVVERQASWSLQALFILMGSNVVTGIHFEDATVYEPADHTSRDRTFQLGRSPQQAQPGDPTVIRDLVFTDNRFDDMCFAIMDSDYPVERAYFVNNVFHPFREAITLGGNRFVTDFLFDVRDTVIAYNTFIPGAFLVPLGGPIPGGQGAIASEIGGGTRLDLSHNLTDGRTNGGFRAGHFWHMNRSHEMVLVSANEAFCTGDKIGDGEAFAFDENANTVGFDFALRAYTASATSVTVEGTLREPTEGYYDAHWVQIAGGRGIGQARRITSVTEQYGQVTLGVTPAWDVVPDTSSLVTVSRAYWQVTVVDNFVDSREEDDELNPVCGKTNQSQPAAGIILFYGPTSDSVIASNLQYDTEGIGLGNVYSVDNPELWGDPARVLYSRVNYSYFVEIRDNLIQGEYAFDNPDSLSGIAVGWGATPEFCIPTIVYGVSIDGNSIYEADARRGGGIAVQWGWYRPKNNDPLRNLLIYGNSIEEIERDNCAGVDDEWEGIGIHVVADDGAGTVPPYREVVWDVVMEDNVFNNVCINVVDHSCTTGSGDCVVECLVDDCPVLYPCAEPGCTQTDEIAATDLDERICEGLYDTRVCPQGTTWHAVEYSCEKADCCLPLAYCICPIGPCPNGNYLECR